MSDADYTQQVKTDWEADPRQVITREQCVDAQHCGPIPPQVRVVSAPGVGGGWPKRLYDASLVEIAPAGSAKMRWLLDGDWSGEGGGR